MTLSLENTLKNCATFIELNKTLDNAQVRLGFLCGRIVSLKSNSEDGVQLSTVVDIVCLKFWNNYCVKNEREALRLISLKLKQWYRITDKTVEESNFFQKMMDDAVYEVVDPKNDESHKIHRTKWRYLGGEDPLPLSHFYCEEEWDLEFPNVSFKEYSKESTRLITHNGIARYAFSQDHLTQAYLAIP